MALTCTAHLASLDNCLTRLHIGQSLSGDETIFSRRHIALPKPGNKPVNAFSAPLRRNGSFTLDLRMPGPFAPPGRRRPSTPPGVRLGVLIREGGIKRKAPDELLN